MRWCAHCGVKYEILHPVWRQVRDVAPSIAPIMTLFAHHGFGRKHQSWCFCVVPSMAPLTRLSAHHGAKCGSMCETMRLSPDNVGAKYGINHPMKHQSWRLLVSPSIAPGVRLCAKHGFKCETERRVWRQMW
jgi:hypothetical protein